MAPQEAAGPVTLGPRRPPQPGRPLAVPRCGRNWSQDSALGGTGRAPRGTRKARGLATAPPAPHSSDHSVTGHSGPACSGAQRRTLPSVDFLGMKLGRLGVRGLPKCPLCPPCSGQAQPGFKAQKRGLPAWPWGAHRGEAGRDAPALRLHGAFCFRRGPRGALPGHALQGCPFPFSLTPQSMGPIFMNQGPSQEEMHSFTRASPLITDFQGAPPRGARWWAGKGKEGEGRG